MIKHVQKYERAGIVSIEDALVAIRAALEQLKKREKPAKASFLGIEMNTKSLRLQTFAEKGLNCVTCGAKGLHFAIERNGQTPEYHLNLWATNKDGDEVLMTHDHILARSGGGKNYIENTQPMCSPCNHEKSIPEREAARNKSKI